MAADMLPQGTAVVLPGLWHLQAFWRTDQTLPPLTDSSTSTSAPAKNPRLSGEAALATTPVPQRRRRECSHSRGSSRPAPGVGPQPRDQRQKRMLYGTRMVRSSRSCARRAVSVWRTVALTGQESACKLRIIVPVEEGTTSRFIMQRENSRMYKTRLNSLTAKPSRD